jgi:hypothetical protein
MPAAKRLERSISGSPRYLHHLALRGFERGFPFRCATNGVAKSSFFSWGLRHRVRKIEKARRTGRGMPGVRGTCEAWVYGHALRGLLRVADGASSARSAERLDMEPHPLFASGSLAPPDPDYSRRALMRDRVRNAGRENRSPHPAGPHPRFSLASLSFTIHHGPAAGGSVGGPSSH